jgi:hypothetical protein
MGLLTTFFIGTSVGVGVVVGFATGSLEAGLVAGLVTAPVIMVCVFGVSLWLMSSRKR